jgi:predicted kinase
MPIGSASTRLIVVRGNSGSGKSSIAQGIRSAHGHGIAWVEQDFVRRMIFDELDQPDGANIGMIERIAGYALDRGFHVVLEGILPTRRYGEMLARLAHEHLGSSFFYYLDVPFDETVRRHATRPKAAAFGLEEMRAWYRARDLLTTPEEKLIDESSSLDETVRLILADSGLRYVPPHVCP